VVALGQVNNQRCVDGSSVYRWEWEPHYLFLAFEAELHAKPYYRVVRKVMPPDNGALLGVLG
jgi:hypothetical protein